MHTKALFEIYEASLENTTGLSGIITEADIAQAVAKKKYDVQDLALIEALINDEEKQFHESLKENLEELSADLAKKNGPESDPDPLKEELISIFMSNLEYYIDLFYNSLLNKHFAGG
ncbi:MAG: hypothetical protein GTN99_06705 [Candidatus Dadabacteria bacterium]|nr:hypothetical protein [Candidatus Dadabacteria bacterium]